MNRDPDDALVDAALLGDVVLCRSALESGADVHAWDERALRSAALNGHVDTVRVLIQAGADVHVFDDGPLRVAAQYGHLDVVRFLLGAGADVHAGDDDALWRAFNSQHFSVAGELIQAGACISQALDEFEILEWHPDALSFMLETPGCLSIEDAERLRRLVLDSPDVRLEPLRQRLKLRDGAAAACAPAGLEMP